MRCHDPFTNQWEEIGIGSNPCGRQFDAVMFDKTSQIEAALAWYTVHIQPRLIRTQTLTLTSKKALTI